MSLLDTFSPDADGAALAEAAARWLEAGYTLDPTGFSADAWGRMAAQGWTALRLPEATGGLDLPLATCLPLVEALGRFGLREPLVESALIAAPLAARAGADAAFLAGLATGDRIAALQDPGAPVTGGAEVTDLLVLDGTTLSLCPAGAAEAWQAVDGRRMADRPKPQGIPLLHGDAAAQALALARAERRACLAAEGCGAMARALGLTAAYLAERKQFGQPLAQFQVLQHRMADMLVELELARSVAAVLIPRPAPPPPAIADRATAHLTRAFRVTGEAAVQLHGGMGMTEEMEIGRVFRRLLTLATLLGGETAPRARLMASSATKDPSP